MVRQHSLCIVLSDAYMLSKHKDMKLVFFMNDYKLKFTGLS
jgi:hypothetical protein